jgi:predicted Zn-dependent peptidase
MKHTVTQVRLDNGTEGLLVHVPDASVMTFTLNFRAGEYLVERQKWETPHLMEHLLLGANKRIPKARAFQAEFEKNGAYSNASTGIYDIAYEAECADFEWKRILDWLMVAITEPLFLEEEFIAEAGNVREELTARSNNHFRHLNIALRESFGFFGMTDQERLKLMHNVNIEDIHAHYQNTHSTSNMRFIIAGNLAPSRRAHIKAVLASAALPKGHGRRKLPKEKPVALPKPLYIPNKTVENYYFYLDTFVKRRLADTELDAMHLLNSMLTETLYSRILGTARERGLVYGMSSNIGAELEATNWWFGAQVRADNAEALLDIIIVELGKVFAGKLDRADIAAAKQYQIGRFQRSGQTVGGVADGYATRYFFDDHVSDYYQIPNRIKAITKTGMVEGAKSLFQQDIWGLGVLGGNNPAHVNELHERLSILWPEKPKH